MKKNLSAILALLLCAGMLSLCGCQQQETSSSPTEGPTASTESSLQLYDDKTDNLCYAKYKEYDLDTTTEIKNIIIMIGDGMGQNHIKAAEIQKGDKLNMKTMKYSGKVTTSSLDGITDSAAASTAISCGYKTHNKSIAVNGDGDSVENLFEFAKSNGMKTGFAVTEFLPHATPAGFSSHEKSRDAFQSILKQQVNNQVNVMLGGGQRFYNDTLYRQLEANNYKYVSNVVDLRTFDKTSTRNLIGMFKYEVILAGYQPSLNEMTLKALNLLNNDNGFCLLVEGSDIDTRASKCDMDGMLREMTVFDNAVDTVLQFAEENPGTLVIVTADHETGGLEIPDNATADTLSNDMFTSGGSHTAANVNIYVDGAQADKFLTNSVIDNTDIAKQVRYLYNGSLLKEPFTYGDTPLATHTAA